MTDMSGSLEDLILAKLTALDLRNDEDTVVFVRELVEESNFEQEDRKSAILGMLELDEEDGSSSFSLSRAEWGVGADQTSSSAVEELLEETQAYQDTVEARRAEEEEAARAAAEPEEKDAPKLSKEELEERRKADLLRQYGQVADETDADRIAREEAERGPDKAYRDLSQLKKKQRKKALDGVDLLAMPNLNAQHVKDRQAAAKSASAAQAHAKREKDKADLAKQKQDAAKKLADKQKKAQKGERRA
ncbi:hypothetical protein JCM10213v2_000055 [Rhodosporidiobolus nylandii]